MKINERQILFFLACVAPVGKIVLLPSRLAETAGNDLLLPAAAHFLLQSLAVFCALLVAKKGESLYDLLSNTCGKVAAKVLCTLFSLFLLFAALLPLLEQKLFVQSVFYDTLPSLVAFSPFFAFSAYLCTKPLFSLGRVWDILAVLSILSLLGIFALSAQSADFGALAPVGASGTGMFFSALRSWSWFFDGALLLPLAGKIEYRKGLAWKGAVCYLAGGAAVLAFLAMFYGIFQETAVNQLFAFTATAKYFPGVAMLGRIDYLFIFGLALVMAFYVAMPMHGAIECALQAYGREHHLASILSVCVSALFLVLILVFEYRFGDVLQAISFVFPLFPLFGLAVPALCLLLRRKRETP